MLIPDSWLMDMSGLTDQLSGERLRTHRATLAVTLQPHQVMVLTADLDRSNGYTPYKRVR